MTPMRCEDCRPLLDGYADNELNPRDTARVRDHLEECGACAAEHRMLTELSARVQAAIERPIAPDVLRARIRGELARAEPTVTRARATSAWRMAAAGVLIAVVSAAGGAYLSGRPAAHQRMVRDAVLSSHVRSLMAGHLTDVASTDQHNVKPWFAGRTSFSPVVPRLDSAGFPLVGGRLDYVGDRVAAAIVYGRRQHVINVFSWPESGARGGDPTLTSEHGYHLVRWVDAGVEYWAASDVSVADLNTFVAIFRQEGAK
jgi:anti-sigma factor RsiW